VKQSAIYTGEVRHRRFTPVRHAFRYGVCMVYLDLEELPRLFDGSRLWSASRPALAWYRRRDFLGEPSVSLTESIRELVADRTGERPEGPIRLLTNLRYFGVLMNPISCYYCFARDGETLEAIVAEVTNTPWGKRHAYVLPVSGSGDVQQIEFDKALHVSPFNPMAMRYHWRSRTPGERLSVHLENRLNGAKVFDATLSLRREVLDVTSLRRLLLIRYPLMTLRIAWAIYSQALALFLKRAPFYPYPPESANIKESTG